MTERAPSATVDLKVRVKESLRIKIEASAAAHGLSMNAEMARRIEQSLETEGQDRDFLNAALKLAYGERAAALLLLMAKAMNDAGISQLAYQRGPLTLESTSWLDDPFAFDHAKKAMLQILERAKPAGEPKLSFNIDSIPDLKAILEKRGIGVANLLIDAVKGTLPPDRQIELEAWAKPLRKALKSLFDRNTVKGQKVKSK